MSTAAVSGSSLLTNPMYSASSGSTTKCSGGIVFHRTQSKERDANYKAGAIFCAQAASLDCPYIMGGKRQLRLALQE